MFEKVAAFSRLRLAAARCRRRTFRRGSACEVRAASAAAWRSVAASLEPFESRVLMSSVVGRYVFYNHSAFDGNDIAANASDEGAIAVDKNALLPGETAGFVNYTSYSRGINGVAVDVAGGPGTL